ncbi:LytR/AlgR family response regulator transcription factor [Cyclobacterium sp. SYSU L10401]|uniref:LytR/AlgR family response regulator transcription factor n=1 Tax=Cyclobacterium sp. SYSU L10401 TaxID=2678657 RepID=UPI0013D69230|nr:response regulator [Cyclobacterium sp. SYSU L10401]
MTKLMIIEDDMVLASDLAQRLQKSGYEVTGIKNNGAEAILHFQKFLPEILLVDIGLRGEMNGIETVEKIQENHEVKTIFLTGNDAEDYFDLAKKTHPFAFISKPFRFQELERTLALLIDQIQLKKEQVQPPTFNEDSIFIRNQNKLVKIFYDDIFYMEAERNYAKIYTKEHTVLVVCPLKVLANKLPTHRFIRIHRSFLVNIAKIEAVGDSFLEINKKTLPISKPFKQDLLRKINTL